MSYYWSGNIHRNGAGTTRGGQGNGGDRFPAQRDLPQTQPAPGEPVDTRAGETFLPPPAMDEATMGMIPETVDSTLYIPGYLRTQIGKIMRVDFLVGNNVIDRVGRLSAVGASYIILQSLASYHTVCDIYSIKFIAIIDDPNAGMETIPYST